MDYSILNNQITIFDTSDFVPKHVLECGQTFRFEKVEKGYKIFSKNLKCDLIYDNEHVIMNSNCPEYFVSYFDLDTDYKEIKSKLSEFPSLAAAIDAGYGIRILKQDPVEMIFSFIISANNNIPRIKLTIEKLCQQIGEKIEGGYAFPTIEAISSQNAEFFKGIGAGYRAEYIVDTAKNLKDGFNLDISEMTTKEARKHLMSLKGVGQKVADCILLFGYNRTDSFPTDVWIEKAYRQLFTDGCLTSREKMADFMSGYFGKLSGYAQQYLYYYTRERERER